MGEIITIEPGYSFGHITVLEKDRENEEINVWLCQCDCGNYVYLDIERLREQKPSDCGCSHKLASGAKNLAGQRFGKLTVIEPTEKRADNGSVVWQCQCDCGNTAEVSARRLLRGSVRSCGCLSKTDDKSYLGRRFGRLSVIEYKGKLGSGSKNYWLCQCDCGNEVTVGQTELKNGDTISCGCYQKEVVREKLSLIDDTSVTLLERGMEKPRSNNKSGYTGVFQEKNGKWTAYINFRKKRYWLGSYDDINEAVKARRRGEEMHEDFVEWYYTQFRNKSLAEKTRRSHVGKAV